MALRAEQQKTKLEEVIDKVRVELVALWDLCSYGAEQKEAFNAHFCDSESRVGTRANTTHSQGSNMGYENE